MSRLSVIIVNFNGGQLIQHCLNRLGAQLPPGSEVIVVDNASEDGSAEVLEGVRLIRNRVNVGFARGVNQGLEVAGGSYLLLLNPDCLLEEGALPAALGYMDANPGVSVLGARVLRSDGRLDPPARRSFKTASTYFYKFFGLSFLFPRSPRFGRYYLSHLPEDVVADVDSVVGAFFLTRRSIVDRIGPLDERFFMYCEDEDWCWRAKQAGGRVVYHPAVVVRHLKGSSAAHRRLRSVWEWHRSLMLYHRKNIAARYPPPVNAVIYVGIGAGLVLASVGAVVKGLVGRLASDQGSFRGGRK